LLNDVQKIVLGFFLPFTLHSSRSDMVKVFQPFEVAYSHTTSIAKNVGQEGYAAVDQNFFSLKGGGSISCLDDEPSLKFVSIVNINCLFQGSWDEEVTFLVNS